MDDTLIDELLAAVPAAVAPTAQVQTAARQEPSTDDSTVTQCQLQLTKVNKHRERLAALAAGGQAKQYLGRAWTVEQIDSLGEDEVEKLYARYEARLGAAMTKTLGQAALQLYTSMAGMFLPIPPENKQALMADLEADPFVSHALGGATCELYHRYGMFLAPLTAALTTAKYCQFGHQSPVSITVPLVSANFAKDGDGGEPDSCTRPGQTEGAGGPASGAGQQ